MAHIYGGILGLLAFLTTIIRGGLHRNDLESTLWTAWLSLILFTLVGLVIGWVAARIVEDSVAGRVAAELAAQEEKSKK